MSKFVLDIWLFKNVQYIISQNAKAKLCLFYV